MNKNHKLDKNWIGEPKEQGGMSNNPHAHIKAPSFSTAKFSLRGNQEIHVQLQSGSALLVGSTGTVVT